MVIFASILFRHVAHLRIVTGLCLSEAATKYISGGSVFAGLWGESYDIKGNHTRTGILIVLIAAFIILMFIADPLKGLIISQMMLSIQLPFTIFMQIYLTSSHKVMGKYANTRLTTMLLILTGVIVSYLNLRLLRKILK